MLQKVGYDFDSVVICIEFIYLEFIFVVNSNFCGIFDFFKKQIVDKGVIFFDDVYGVVLMISYQIVFLIICSDFFGGEIFDDFFGFIFVVGKLKFFVSGYQDNFMFIVVGNVNFVIFVFDDVMWFCVDVFFVFVLFNFYNWLI